MHAQLYDLLNLIEWWTKGLSFQEIIKNVRNKLTCYEIGIKNMSLDRKRQKLEMQPFLHIEGKIV